MPSLTDSTPGASRISQAKEILALPGLMRRLGLGDHAKKSAPCPFHDDQHNSFSVWQKETGLGALSVTQVAAPATKLISSKSARGFKLCGHKAVSEIAGLKAQAALASVGFAEFQLAGVRRYAYRH